MKRWHFICLLLVCLGIGSSLVIPIFSKQHSFQNILSSPDSDMIPPTGDDNPPNWWEPATGDGVIDGVEINYTAFFQFFRNHVEWFLMSDFSGDWLFYNDSLEVSYSQPQVNARKISWVFDTHPSLTAGYRCGFSLDLSFYNWSRSGGEEYKLRFLNNLRSFVLSYNWSDLRNIPGISFNHGWREDVFYFYCQKELLPNQHIVFDPLVEINVTGLSGSTGDPNQRSIIRNSTGVLHTVFRAMVNGKVNIRHAYSSDEGKTWATYDITANSTYHQYAPAIAVDSLDNLHVVWYGNTVNGFQIRYVNCSGGVWSSVVNLTNNSLYAQYYPVVAVDSSDMVHVVFSGLTAGHPGANVLRYMNCSSGIWSNVHNCTDYNAMQQTPSIAIDSANTVHIAWMGYQIGVTYAIRYLNHSVSGWSSIHNVTSGARYQDYSPCIATDSLNAVHITWDGYTAGSPGTLQIRYVNTTGGVWNPILNVTNMPIGQTQSSVAIDGSDVVHLMWVGRTNATVKTQIRYTNNSGSWFPHVNLTTDNVENKQAPSLLWATYPDVSGIQCSRPATGYAGVFSNGSKAIFINSSDVTWDTALPVWHQTFTWNVSFSNGTMRNHQVFTWNISFSNLTAHEFTWNVSFSNSVIITVIYPENQSNITSAQPSITFRLDEPANRLMNYTVSVGNSSQNATFEIGADTLVTDGIFSALDFLGVNLSEPYWYHITANSSALQDNVSGFYTIIPSGGGSSPRSIAIGASALLIGGFALVMLFMMRTKAEKPRKRRRYDNRKRDKYGEEWY